MLSPSPELHEENLGELFHQLVDEGKALARAEVDLVKATAGLRLSRAKVGLALLVTAVAVFHLCLIAGAVELAVALATLVGPLASGLIVLIGGAVVAFVLIRVGVAKLKPAFAPLPTGAA